MNILKLYIEEDDKKEEILFQERRMINAGYTGRNQEGVKRHIDELKKQGIPAPETTPAAYEVITRLICFNQEIEVVGNKTSGEAEFVLLCSGEEVYVGVGSDHTDRELEKVNIVKSKQICPNVMSNRIWRLKNVKKDWDEIILRSWVKNNEGVKNLYQESSLDKIMTPEDLLAFIKNKLVDEDLNGAIIYSGTVPILTEEINYNNYFEVELYNPKNEKKLGCAYQIKVLNYLRR